MWVKYLYKTVSSLNSRKLKLDSVELKIKPYGDDRLAAQHEQELLPTDGLYRYLLQPGEEHGDQKHRATDKNWSKDTYRLSEIVENPGQRVLYYLSEGPQRAFVREELMLIPEVTELPPDWVKEW